MFHSVQPFHTLAVPYCIQDTILGHLGTRGKKNTPCSQEASRLGRKVLCLGKAQK